MDAPERVCRDVGALCRQLGDTVAVGLLIWGLLVEGKEGDGATVASPVLIYCSII